MPMSGRRGARGRLRGSLHAVQPVGDQSVGSFLNPRGHVGVRGSTMRWIVFETTEAGRIVRGGDHDPVGQSALAAAVVAENRVRDYRGWGVSARAVNHHLDAVGRQYL